MAAIFAVQDATGLVVNANAYVALAAFKQYHDNAGNDYSTFTDPQIQTAIVRATFYVDNRFTFPGRKLVVIDANAVPPVTADQPTQWPRTSPSAFVVCPSPLGFGFDSPYIYYGLPGAPSVPAGIPPALVQATAEYALRALSAKLFIDNPGPSDGRLVKSTRDKVDVLESEVVYADAGLTMNGSFIMPAFPLADLILRRANLVTSTGRLLVR